MKKYNHVIVIGVDGAGSFVQQADTPNFDRIFAGGAYTYHALASRPTDSGECWGSMLLGVGPDVHKLHNEHVSTYPYPVDAPNPSLFRRIRAAMPDAELGSFCDWNPITFGMVESNLGVTSDTCRDTELIGRICDYIREKKPTFLFTQLDSVDGAGHAHGYGSEKHLQQIHIADEMLGQAYQAVLDAGIQDDTLFMMIADHGGKGCGHGGWSDSEKLTTFACVGPTVQRCDIEEMNIRDLAAITLYALGIEAPEFSETGWTSQVPVGIFADDTLPEYRDISHLAGGVPRISRVQHITEIVTDEEA